MNKFIIALMLLTKTLLIGYSQGGGSPYHHKRWVLNNTNHFYFGFDKGMLFDFGQVAANDP